MNMLSKILVVLGTIIAVIGNAIAFYSSSVAINGMLNAASAGIGAVAWGMTSSHFWNIVGLIGCVILVLGLILSMIKKTPATL